MLSPEFYQRPIAHRGLHSARAGVIENTADAFEAAIAKGYGVECDVRPAANGLPIVFHDKTLDRLCMTSGDVGRLVAPDLRDIRYRASSSIGILTLAEFLDLVAGRAPVFVEIKSEWTPPDPRFLLEIARLAAHASGPLALMSFDPLIIKEMAHLAPGVPRGVVSGSYRGAGWWRREVSAQRARVLRDLGESPPGEAHFFAYEIGALPTPATEYARRVRGLPVLTWTVRSPRDRERAAKWADQMIFEGFEP